MPKSPSPLLANISHDFRTPLTVIKEYASILGDGLIGELSPEQHEFLKVIQDRADDLALVVDNMLDLNKAHAGTLGVWRRETTVADILHPIIPALQHKAALRKATLEVAMPDTLPPVYADAEKIGRVIANIFADTVKHCRDQSSLRLWARSSEDRREVAIGLSDDRPDFTANEVEALCRKVRLVNHVPGGGYRGLGIGLRSACRLVDAHFGRIDFELGEPGATCYFTLPVREPAAILACWLRGIERVDGSTAKVSLVHIATAAPVERGASNVIDEFLQYAFRRRDLVLRRHLNDWSVASHISADQLPMALDRVKRRWAKVTGKRFSAALPQLTVTSVGAWPIAEAGEFLQRFKNEPCQTQVLAEI